MIRFHQIEWKNFLSQGDQPVCLNLDTDHTTLIRGKNGAGKTTVLDAICYALFNKSLRPVKLSQLINSINKKKMLVTVRFSVNGSDYQVRRGQKPSVFEISKDGEVLPQQAAARDQQTQLEAILGCDYKTFTQVVVIASTGYQNFMELAPADRRTVVEQMLDIQVIGKMAEHAKQRKKDVQQKKLMADQNYSSTQQKIDSVRRLIDDVTKNSQGAIDNIDATITSKTSELEALKRAHKEAVAAEPEIDIDQAKLTYQTKQNELSEHQNKVQLLMQQKSDKQSEMYREIEAATQQLMEDSWNQQVAIDKEISDILSKQQKQDKTFSKLESDFRLAISQIDNKTSDMTAQKEYYSSHENCDSCGQDIDSEFSQNKINEADQVISQNASDKTDLETKKRNTHESRVQMNEDFNSSVNALKEKQNSIREAAEANKETVSADIKEKYVGYAQELNHQITQIQSGDIPECKRVIDEINEMANQIKDWQTQCDAILNNARGCHEMIQTYNQQKIDLIDKNQSNITQYQAEIAELNVEIDTIIKRRAEITEEEELVEMSLVMLKDTGLKAKIVRQYLPLINESINQYLDTMGANYSFHLDESFNETIKSRYRDNFSYSSFSNGEKARINLAILMMWRKLSESKNTVSSNLLFIDEVLDGSLDKKGIDSVFDIFHTMPNSNLFIISHRKEIIDRFDNVITVSKVGNYASYDMGKTNVKKINIHQRTL